MEDLRASFEEGVKIIYFGDSVIKSIAKKDTDGRHMGEMLQDQLNQEVKIISHGGYHLGVYEAFLHYMCDRGKKPEIIIIPINLRSFGNDWDTRADYLFIREINISKYLCLIACDFKT